MTQLESLEFGSLELTEARLPNLQGFSFLKSLTFALRPTGYPAEIRTRIKALLPKVLLIHRFVARTYRGSRCVSWRKGMRNAGKSS
jgi:hypothetical protein